MHRQLRKALLEAEGFSDLVVVIFLDVRGFSNFAGMAESSEAAIFLRRMYLDIIDDYFPDSAFFKPTGDGLMIIRHFDRESLQAEVQTAITMALNLVQAFPRMTAEDPMVNFEVPKSLGIGIARGAATRLASGDFTLDYSGRPLNLAARLMDLARPSGVVFDSRLVKGLDLPVGLMSRFEQTDVYLKGIADTVPMEVYASGGVRVPARNKRPLDGVPFETATMKVKFKDLVDRHLYIHKPPVEPTDPHDVELEVISPVVLPSGNKSAAHNTVRIIKPYGTRRTASGWEVTYDYTDVAKEMSDAGVKKTWDVSLRLRYLATEKPTPGDAVSVVESGPADEIQSLTPEEVIIQPPPALQS